MYCISSKSKRKLVHDPDFSEIIFWMSREKIFSKCNEHDS